MQIFGDKFYGLKISGTYNYSEGLKNYYTLKPNPKKKIYKTSYIDLRYIYELECTNNPPNESIVSEQEFEKILEKLGQVQLTRKDANYIYVKEYYSKK